MESTLEKFNKIVTFVKNKNAWLLNNDFADMSADEAAKKLVYQAMDKTIREKLTDEQSKELDKVNLKRDVLEYLKEQVQDGRLTGDEIDHILNSDEFKNLMQVKSF